MRALGFVCLNRWKEPFLKHDAKQTKVLLGIDGHKIIRIKGKKENSYRLNGKKFVSFGQSKVPTDIENLLGVNDDNFQFQLDSPFWFEDSAGSISKKLNTIVNLGSIDKTLFQAASDLRKETAILEVVNDRYKKLKDEIDSKKWVDDCKPDLDRIEKLELSISSQTSKFAILGDILKTLENTQQAEKNAANAMLGAKKLLVLAKRQAEERRKAKNLADLIGQIERSTKLADVEIPSIGELDSEIKQLEKLDERIKELTSIITNITKAKETKCRNKKDLDRVRKTLTQMESICPTCGQTRKAKRTDSSSRTQSR
jgi:hypothetical protein